MELKNETIELVGLVLALFVTRWMLDLSTPQKDWQTFQRWRVKYIPLETIEYYRFPEVLHQIRGSRVLWHKTMEDTDKVDQDKQDQDKQDNHQA